MFEVTENHDSFLLMYKEISVKYYNRITFHLVSYDKQ